MVRTTPKFEVHTMTEVVSWIEHHARRTPERIALVDLHRGREITYRELAQRSRSLAWSLSTDHHVGLGDRVAVLSRNDARVFEVLYACALLGAIAVPLNWRLTSAELTAITGDAEPAVLVHESWAERVAAEVASAADIGRRIGWASEQGDDDGYEPLAARGAPPDWTPDPVDQDAVWTIIYTSGTTTPASWPACSASSLHMASPPPRGA